MLEAPFQFIATCAMQSYGRGYAKKGCHRCQISTPRRPCDSQIFIPVTCHACFGRSVLALSSWKLSCLEANRVKRIVFPSQILVHTPTLYPVCPRSPHRTPDRCADYVVFVYRALCLLRALGPIISRRRWSTRLKHGAQHCTLVDLHIRTGSSLRVVPHHPEDQHEALFAGSCAGMLAMTITLEACYLLRTRSSAFEVFGLRFLLSFAPGADS